MVRRSLIVLLLFLVGCEVTPTPPPAPVSFSSIGTTPELEALVVSWVMDYREEVNDDIIQVYTYSPDTILSKVQTGDSDLIITALSPPEGWFASPISRQPVVIVVNRENDVETLTVGELMEIFSGRNAVWEQEAIPIQPIVPLEGYSTRLSFEAYVMKGNTFSPSAFLAPTPGVMLELVQEYVGAIGFMLQRDVSNEVRQIGIADTSSTDQTSGINMDPLWIDLLAISIDEPQGHLRDFLVWLQSE